MTSQENILSFLRQQKKRFFEEYRLVKLGLFGSFARGDETEASDIDLIVEFAPGTEDLFGKKQQLREIVEQQFDRPVDVCREKYIKPYFRAQILSIGHFCLKKIRRTCSLYRRPAKKSGSSLSMSSMPMLSLPIKKHSTRY
ncbi:MAG: nucleotidyltransferase domain-containing protein [Haliscomenobacter sp.]|nr:nucleotidyltransferase domain-containing protein [Haliscomenobacter sp.]